MRWSLILSTSLTVLSTLSVALVIPTFESSIDLERRGETAKASSKTYRKNSEKHDYAYKFDKSGGVTREKLKASERPANGKQVIKIPKTDAGKSIALKYILTSGPFSLTHPFSFLFSIVDHVFEHQMLAGHLKTHGLDYKYVFYFDIIFRYRT